MMCTLLSVPVMESGTLTLSLLWTVPSLTMKVSFNMQNSVCLNKLYSYSVGSKSVNNMFLVSIVYSCVSHHELGKANHYTLMHTSSSLYAGDGTSLESYRAGIIALSLIVIIQTALLVVLLVKIFLAKRSNTHTYNH